MIRCILFYLGLSHVNAHHILVYLGGYLDFANDDVILDASRTGLDLEIDQYEMHFKYDIGKSEFSHTELQL